MIFVGDGWRRSKGFCSMFCSSPMSAQMPPRNRKVDCRRRPECAYRLGHQCQQTDGLSVTVLPPVLGPVTNNTK